MKKYFLILFLLIASQAWGADWYTSPTGTANCASGCLTGAAGWIAGPGGRSGTWTDGS